MATKIKLMRLGKMRAPYYRIVVADARTKRDGRSIETIGKYHPKEDPSFIEVDSERAQYWLGVGAQPTEAVAAIFRVTGDWQKFKGEPAPAAHEGRRAQAGQEGPLRGRRPRRHGRADRRRHHRQEEGGAEEGRCRGSAPRPLPSAAAEAPAAEAPAEETPAPAETPAE